MSDPFIAEIKIFAGNFAPRGFAFCDGQLLPISQNTALFSLIGTTYGGDGRTTMALPNLQGKAPMHPGDGPGLSNRRLGETGGSETATLTATQMAAHNHQLMAANVQANTGSPEGNTFAQPNGGNVYSESSSSLVQISNTLQNTGGGQPHNNTQPYLAMNFIIALVGLFPSRS